jgi:hypothetical protein
MNLEQMKTEWQQYDHQLSKTNRLNEQLIESMIRERSRSRVDWIRKESMLLLFYMTGVTLFLVAIFAGNPFDFRFTWQYVPYGILATGVLMAIVSLVKNIRNFDVDINRVDLFSFLNRTIDGYEKNKKLESWFGVIILSAGLLTVFSFLPNKMETKSLNRALIETAVAAIPILLVYFLAFRLGAFKNRRKEAFENDLKELKELKAMSGEVKDAAMD